jgi:uncharacterized Zn-finger protein
LLLVILNLIVTGVLGVPGLAVRLAERAGCTEAALSPTVDVNPLLLPLWQEDVETIDDVLDVSLLYQSPHLNQFGASYYETELDVFFNYEDYDGEAGWLCEFVHSLLSRNQSVVSVNVRVYPDDAWATEAFERRCSGERWGFAHPEIFVDGQQADSVYCYSYVKKLFVEDQSLDACWPYHSHHWFVVVQKRNMVIEIDEITWTSRVLHLQEVIDRVGVVLRR